LIPYRATGAPLAAPRLGDLAAGAATLNSPAIPLASFGAELSTGCHACAFFEDPEQEYRALLPFAQDCLRCGDRCAHFGSGLREQERFERFAAHAIDVAGSTASGQLALRTWEHTYLRGGCFDIEGMLALVAELMREGRAAFGRTRLWGDMEWSLSGQPGCDRLIEYESRLNTLLDGGTDVVLCVYDVRKYSAGMVMDVLRTHPMLVVGEHVHPNPLFVPSEQFLSEYRRRGAIRPRAGEGTDPDPAAA
jgi:hypothetical protein